MTAIVPPSAPGDYECHHRPFKKFLKVRGAELFTPHHGIILRFRTQRGYGIIERAQDLLWWSMEAERAWRAFQQNDSWKAYPYPDPISQARRKDTINALVQRDGPHCVYCWSALTPEDATIEHFVPRNAGGRSHINNLGLCCLSCNRAGGSLSVPEKISIAVRGSVG